MIDERAKYEKMWTLDKYRRRSPGLGQVDHFLTTCRPSKGDHILDVGTGRGVAVGELIRRGYLNTAGIDIASNAVNPDIRYAYLDRFRIGDYLTTDTLMVDWIFCCDFLEHLPPEQLRPALEKIKHDSIKGLYLQVPTFPSSGKKWDDSFEFELHYTVMPAIWWKKLFIDIFGEGTFEHFPENRRVVFYRKESHGR